MAEIIMMSHPQTGIIKKGIYGFSWTTLFFGGLPALFRGDIVMGLVVTAINIITFGVAGFIWAFIYNKQYTLKLVEQGYKFDASEAQIALARSKLGIVAPVTASVPA